MQNPSHPSPTQIDQQAKITMTSFIDVSDLESRDSLKKKLELMVEGKIGENLTLLVDKLLELAQGVDIYKETNAQGFDIKKVYSKPPDREAIQYLIDRLLGRPIERQEIKSEKKGLMIVESIIKNLADAKSNGSTRESLTGNSSFSLTAVNP